MDQAEFVTEIRAAWSLLKEKLEIGRAFVSPGPLKIDPAFREVALDDTSTYEQIFRSGLNRSHYNVLLTDYAYFQFGHSDEQSWRLAYFPNPWLTGLPAAEQALRHWETLEEIGALTYEEATDFIADLQYTGSVPPIRFELAPDQYKEFAHPAAHFHIGRHTGNRWPSAISIGPKAFALIIAKLYYPEAWARCSTYCGAGVPDCIEQVLTATIANVRFVYDFSEQERRSFHFGKNMFAPQQQ